MSAAQSRQGDYTVSYAASSVTVTASPGTLATYTLFYDDPAYAGGSRTLQATDAYANLFNANGRAFVGMIDVLFAVAGGGNTGGNGTSGGGGGNYQEP